MLAALPYAGCEGTPDRRTVFGDASVGVVAQTLRMPTSMPLHGHQFAGLIFVRGGVGLYESGSGTIRIGKGVVLIFQPGDHHGFRGCRNVRVTNVVLDDALFERELAWLRGDPLLNLLIWCTGGELSAAARALRPGAERWERIESELDSLEGTVPGEVGEHVRRLGHLLCLVGELASEFTPPPVTSEAVTLAIKAMNQDLRRDWTMTDLSASVGFSAAHLTRLFTSCVGMAPMAFLTRLRAEHAAALLTETELSVSDIARSSGWHDPNYASRRFRAVYGVSPTEYRRLVRSGAEPPAAHGVPD